MSKFYELMKRSGSSLGEPEQSRAELLQYEPVPALPPPPDDRPAVLHYLQILFRRRWIVLAVTLCMLALAAIASFLMTTKYEAVARISVGRDNSNQLGFKDSPASSGGADYDMDLEGEAKILMSDNVVLQNLRKLGVIHNTTGEVDHAINAGQELVAEKLPKSDALQLAIFQSGLNVSRVGHTRLIEITFRGPDPVLAAKFVNGQVAAYLEHNFRAKYEATTQVSSFLSKQLEDLKTKFESSQQKLVEYETATGLAVDDKDNIVTQRLADINHDLQTAEADRIQKQAFYEQTLTANSEVVPEAGENPTIRHLKEQQADLRNQYAEASSQMGSAHPRVIQLKDQLAQIETALGDETGKVSERNHNAYLIARTRENMLRASLEQEKKKATEMHEEAIQYGMLKRDMESNQRLYEGLLQKLKEASVSAGLNSSNITVVDPARVPNAPVVPNIPLNLALGLLAGGFLGSVAAFVIDRFDSTVHNSAEAEALVQLPALANIPEIPRQVGRSFPPSISSAEPNGRARDRAAELISSLQPNSMFAECYRALRTSLLFASPHSAKVILITSSVSKEGKSTTSLNLAAVLAQAGKHVLLVDADFRAPSLHTMLGVTNDVGLSTILDPEFSGNALDFVLNSDRVPGVSVLASGPSPDLPGEVLASKEMKSYLGKFRTIYDYVVIDSPPVLAATESVVISAECDVVLLTVRAGQTDRTALLRTHELLRRAGANVAGIVVNYADFDTLNHGDYRYYYGGDRNGQDRVASGGNSFRR